MRGLSTNAVFGLNFQISVNFFYNFLNNIAILPQKFYKKFPQNCENLFPKEHSSTVPYYILPQNLYLFQENRLRQMALKRFLSGLGYCFILSYTIK